MKEIDWSELKRIFAEACELVPEARSALLDQRCAGKPELRAELDAYLRQHEQLQARPAPQRPSDGVSTEDTPTDVLLGRLREHSPPVQRYQLRGEIARGGMGAILKVWDENLRRDLAMKVVLGKALPGAGDGTPGMDPQTLGRFLEEAQVTGQLDHPGIVPVHELGLDSQGRVFFTMKLVKGRDLKDVFKLVFAGQEGWNETRALGVILKACEAMAYAHAKGVIHRDLKPANVMVGNFGEVYVMDWGIARVQGRKDSHDIRIAPELTTELGSIKSERREEREDVADSPLLTRDGDVLGTPAYMAPEQARGEIEQLGPRSDVYSMGAMLYHLLARHAPYLTPGARIHNRTLLAMVLQGPPAPLASLRDDLPQELVAICEKAMAREASQRYADTLALAEDLRAFLEHRVVGAYETGAWAEARKWVQRNRPLAASLATALLLLVAGLTASLVYKARADEQRELADGQRAAALRSAALEKTARETAVAKEAEAMKQTAIAEAVARFQADMLAAADPQKLLGDKVTVLQALQGAVQELDQGSLADQPLVEAGVRDTIGITLIGLSRYDEAELNLRKSLEIRRATLAPGDTGIATGLGSLAVVLQYQSKLVEAERLHREALEIDRAALPPGHPNIARDLSNLAQLLQAQNRLGEAELLFREALEIYRAVHPAGHPDIAVGLNTLASLLQDQDKLAEAEPLYREALEIWRAALPVGHPNIATGLNDLASLLCAEGKLAEAEPLFREALEIRRASLPAGHPGIAQGLNNLAWLLHAQNKLVEAERFFREALEICRAAYPPGHPEIATSLCNLAALLHAQDKYAEAEPLSREALEIWRAALPAGHPDIALGLNVLALLLQRQEKFAEAEPLFREALEICRAAHPAGHPNIVRCLSSLASLLQAQNRFAEAELFYREALTIRESKAPDDWQTSSARSMLGGALLGQKKLAQAEPLLLDGYRGMKEREASIPPQSATRILESLELLVQLYGAKGDATEAAAWRSKLEAARAEQANPTRDERKR